MASGLRARKVGPASSAVVAAAVARVRANRALRKARALFTRTNFAGCISLLSITEQELGRNLGARADLRGHRVLAKTNFWLGVCQWAAGDPQRAAASFVRSAQLPGAPAPDGKLLPPKLVRHYRRAVAAPRVQKTCKLDPAINAANLLVDGKGPTLRGRGLDVPAGAHYIVLRGSCDASGRCSAPRSLRLQASGMSCSVRPPPSVSRSALVCVNAREASDARFAGAVADEAELAGVVVVSVSGDKVSLRIAKRAARSFSRALHSNTRKGDAGGPAAVVRRSLGLLLGDAGVTPGGRGGSDRDAWYRKWWVWTLVGVAAAATITGIAVGAAASSSRVDIVFTP